jgi:hypothetical protein
MKPAVVCLSLRIASQHIGLIAPSQESGILLVKRGEDLKLTCRRDYQSGDKSPHSISEYAFSDSLIGLWGELA